MFPSPESYSHSLDFSTRSDFNKLQYKAIFNLNFFSLAVSHEFDYPNKIQILIDFFQAVQINSLSFSSTNFRLILFPIHILKMVIRKRN